MPLDEDRLRQLWQEGATCDDIGKQLGCSRTLVSKRALSLGLPRRNTDTTRLPARMIVSAYVDHGMTLEEIRDQLRKQFPLASVLLVRNLLKSRGVKMQPRWRRKIESGNTKLQECVQLARAGWSYKRIAKAVGLTVRQVNLRVRKVLPPLARTETARKYGVAEIVKAWQQEGSYAKAARRLGCHWSTIRYHVARAVAS